MTDEKEQQPADFIVEAQRDWNAFMRTWDGAERDAFRAAKEKLIDGVNQFFKASGGKVSSAGKLLHACQLAKDAIADRDNPGTDFATASNALTEAIASAEGKFKVETYFVLAQAAPTLFSGVRLAIETLEAATLSDADRTYVVDNLKGMVDRAIFGYSKILHRTESVAALKKAAEGVFECMDIGERPLSMEARHRLIDAYNALAEAVLVADGQIPPK